MQSLNDGRWALLGVTGWMLLGLALVNALLLRRRADAGAVRLWTAALVVLGVGVLLLSSRPRLPVWLGYTAAIGLLVLHHVLRAMALRAWAGRPLHGARLLAVVVAFTAAFHGLLVSGQAGARMAFAQVGLGLGYQYVAFEAWRLWRRQPGMAALALAGFEAVAGLSVAGLVPARLLLGEPLGVEQSMLPLAPLALLAAVVVAGALLPSAAFIGLVLEQLRQAERVARDAEQRAVGRQEAAEAQGRQLQVLAEQQRRLADERERLLRLIAHEVRQPLHNASGVLQALRLSLARLQPPGQPALVQRAARADAVLGQVRDVLDNVLVASLLLEDERPLTLQAIDLRLALELAVLDLSDDQRARVTLQIAEAPQELAVEPNLLRLALRNLLRNACEHGGAAVRVILHARRQPADGALVLAVQDDGVGFPAAVLAAVVAATGSGPLQLAPDGLGRGLGLQVAARVARRHGVQLRLANRAEGGASAALVWPAA